MKQEINPRLLPVSGPQDTLIVAGFSVECGASSGRIDWLLPESMLAPIREILASDGGKVPARKLERVGSGARARLCKMQKLKLRAILAQAQDQSAESSCV